MPLNSQFFAAVRSSLFQDGLSQQQVDALNSVTAVFDGFTGHEHCVDDLAYVFATCYRECGPSLNLGIEEYGKGKGKAYGVAAGQYGKVYYGRGPCQITWLANYQRSKLRTNIDFVQFPEKMCDPQYGIACMLDGMYAGLFTQKSLRSYITPGKVTTLADFVNCRRIINGTDHAGEIAANAVLFQRALLTGYDKPVNMPPVLTATATSPVAQQPQRRGLVWEVARLFGKG